MSSLLWEVSDGVARMTLNRPEAMNAWDAEIVEGIASRLAQAGEDDAVRVVVVTGAGRAFSAGGDVKGFAAGLAEGASLLPAMERTSRAIEAVRACPLPVIAAVNGPAAGVAVGFTLACDLVHVARSASFTLGFDKLGLMLDGGATYTLPTILGKARATEMALLGERLSPERALEWGLVNGVHDDDALLPAVDELAQRLAHGPTRAYAANKAAINSAVYGGLTQALAQERDGQVELYRSSDFSEGVMAFVGKRRPEFTGR